MDPKIERWCKPLAQSFIETRREPAIIAQAFSQESSAQQGVEHGAPQTLVHFYQRAASDREAKSRTQTAAKVHWPQRTAPGFLMYGRPLGNWEWPLKQRLLAS